MTAYQVSNKKFTALVITNEQSEIIETAPCYKKFKYQYFDRLIEWSRRTFGRTEIYNLDRLSL